MKDTVSIFKVMDKGHICSFFLFCFVVVFKQAEQTIYEEDFHFIEPKETFNVLCSTSVPTNEFIWRLEEEESELNQTLDSNLANETSYVQDGVTHKNASIQCNFNTNDENYLDKIVCLHRNGTWIKTYLETKVSIPGSIFVSMNCFEMKGAVEGGIMVHVGRRPNKPAEVSCVILESYRDLFCSWSNDTDDSKYRIFHQDYLTSYTLEYNAIHSNITEIVNCTTSSCCSIRYVETDNTHPFPYLSLFNVSIKATNGWGSSSTAISHFSPAVLTPPPQAISVETEYKNEGERVDLVISFTFDNNETKSHEIEVDLEILFSEKSSIEINRLIDEEKNAYDPQKVFTCLPKKFQLHNVGSMLEKQGDWRRKMLKDTKQNLTVGTTIKDVPGNATVVVRARCKISDNFYWIEKPWSLYTYGKVTKTRSLKPGKLDFSVLWFNKETDAIKTYLPTTTKMVFLWQKNNGQRYRFNGNIMNTMWSWKCYSRGMKKNTQQIPNCSVELCAENEAGFSRASRTIIANFGQRYEIKPSCIEMEQMNTTSFHLQFACLFCDETGKCSENCKNMERWTLMTHFWKLEREDYYQKNVFHDQNKEKKYNFSSFVNWTVGENSKNSDGGLLVMKNNKMFIENGLEESGRLRHQPIHFTTSSITKCSADTNCYNSIVSSSLDLYAVYRIAISVKMEERQGPAITIPFGYTILTKSPTAPPYALSVTPLSTSQILVSWYPVYLQNQHGRIIEYLIYVALNEYCGKRRNAHRGSEACNASCPNPVVKVSYIVKDEKSNSRIWSEEDIADALGTGRLFSQSVSNLDAQKDYCVMVSAVNGDGEGPCSKPVKIRLENRLVHHLAIAFSMISLLGILVFAGFAFQRYCRNKLLTKVPSPIIFDDIVYHVPSAAYQTDTAEDPEPEHYSPIQTKTVDCRAEGPDVMNVLMAEGSTTFDEDANPQTAHTSFDEASTASSVCCSFMHDNKGESESLMGSAVLCNADAIYHGYTDAVEANRLSKMQYLGLIKKEGSMVPVN